LSSQAHRLLAFGVVVAGLFSACGSGGGGSAPDNAVINPPTPLGLRAADLAVLIRVGDATSEAIGVAYQQARGIPEAHMMRVSFNGSGDAISSTDFAALKATLDTRLPATAQATLVTWAQPSRVQGPTCSMGITSALAVGYSVNGCGGCVATAASPYYNSDSNKPFTDLKMRPSMMLGASTLAQAQALIARGVAADGSLANVSNPATGTSQGLGYFVRTTDPNRSIRWADFQAAAALNVPGISMNFIDNAAGSRSDLISNQNNVMFYLTGLVNVAQISSNRYLPGAVADHLTSTGGLLPDGGGQMPITDWLAAGASASYGTVEEPCNYGEKFPRATVLVSHYARGESLIEAYWKSVQWPGQGLFVGEPLARPWSK
jgi:uncharacterized protein (TIGR03790 family)